ncbi:hypothetical protein GUJ93_ZPchr0011g28181 [Zizania palustris]|uniref:Beta-galactosidase beta-sandwich domain-containing protein n=1 Tax=Zizania palustris TaxID=103762 RepID=A0A8J5WHQ1_ZIZPA|nr:hypothetical protein GUJ93_ZPchr0011g28181 [Zizania palustris]
MVVQDEEDEYRHDGSLNDKSEEEDPYDDVDMSENDEVANAQDDGERDDTTSNPSFEFKVRFNGQHYNLPAWSISIFPDCKIVVFNTAMVKEPTLLPKMNPVVRFAWQSYNANTKSLDDRAFTKDGLVEQLSMTWDKSDYMWYTTYVNIGPNEQFLKSIQSSQLTVYSVGHSMQVFVNGKSFGINISSYLHFILDQV